MITDPEHIIVQIYLITLMKSNSAQVLVEGPIFYYIYFWIFISLTRTFMICRDPLENARLYHRWIQRALPVYNVFYFEDREDPDDESKKLRPTPYDEPFPKKINQIAW